MKREAARVLVVDDEESIRKTLRLCLEGAGYTVSLASSGEAAVAMARRAPPTPRLVDLRLGGLDGIGVLSALAEEAPATIVVLMTAYATIDNAVDAMRKGAIDYLPKPFTPAQVLHVVARALEGKRLRAELAELHGGALSRRVHARPRDEIRCVPRGDRSRGARGADGRDRAPARRERHRQGRHRAAHPRALAAQATGRS